MEQGKITSLEAKEKFIRDSSKLLLPFIKANNNKNNVSKIEGIYAEHLQNQNLRIKPDLQKVFVMMGAASAVAGVIYAPFALSYTRNLFARYAPKSKLPKVFQKTSISPK